MKFYNKILPLLLLIISGNIYALDIGITSKSVEGYAWLEDNNSFGIFGGLSAIGEIELNTFYKFRGGLSLAVFEDNIDLKSFASFNAVPFAKVSKPKFLTRLDFTAAWNYNGLFAYEVHSNSFYAFATYNWKRVNLSLGYNLRFTSFLGEESIFEATPMYSFCFKFINNENHYFGLIWGNFNEFQVKNSVDYSYNFFYHVRINDNWKLITNLEFLQSGAIAFTETLYGVVFRAGVRYTW